MAEVVELNIEDMIPELEVMEKLGVLTKTEIKGIIRKRKAFEYRLQRVSKMKDDLIKYIHYEMGLLRLIQQKMHEKGLGAKKNSIEYSIMNHVNKLFSMAIRRYASDIKIWLAYIRFCKQVRFYTCVSRILDQMLDLHGTDKPQLYKLAAQWEFDECNSIDRARKYLYQGLHMHKDSKILYTEGFRLELAYTKMKLEEAKAKSDNVDMNDPILRGDMANVMYESASKKINDVSFYVELLKIPEELKVTTTLKKRIIDDMRERFPNEEITWDTLAKRELELQGTLKERIEKLVQTYQKGLQIKPTQKMWNFYLEKVLDLNEDQQTLPNFKKNCLKSAFEAAHNAGMLTEKYYIIWIKKVEDVDTAKILQLATERHKDSVKLWCHRVKHYLSRSDEAGALTVFKEAISNPNLPDQLSLWNLILKYYQMVDPQKGEGLWKEAVTNMSVGARLKGRYVEWLAVSRGILAARRAYDQMCNQVPLSLELHVSMSKLEDAQPKLSLKHARNVYENAIQQFGRTNTDVWMWYVRFEERFGDANNVSLIYERAINTLKADLVDVFISEYHLNKADPCPDNRRMPMQVTPRPEPMDIQFVDETRQSTSS